MDEVVKSKNCVRLYIDQIEGELLTPKEEERLFLKLEGCREELIKTKLTHECIKCVAVKKEIIEKNLRYVVKLAKQYPGRGFPIEDLIQEGNLGLIKAVAKFDVRRGYRFTTYATWWIRQSITRAINTKAGIIRLPMQRVERVQKFIKLFRKEIKDRNEEIEFSEFIMRLGNVEDAKRVIADHEIYTGSIASIDGEMETDNPKNCGGSLNLLQVLEDKNSEGVDTITLKEEVKKRLGKYVENLPKPKQIEVMSKRFGVLKFRKGGPRTLEQVGKESEPPLTRERIRQIERDGLKILKREMEANPEDLEMFKSRLFMHGRV